MIDQYFGTKELYQVVLKANTPMNFGYRKIETGEPVLYFENINMALLTEQNHPILARGGWGNTPRVVWEDRSEVTFSLIEGVMSSVGLGILTSARVLTKEQSRNGNLYLPKKEGPFMLDSFSKTFLLAETPALNKKIFCYEYEDKIIQKRVDFNLNNRILKIEDGDINKEYLIDYYYQYGEEAFCYLIEKERFNGTFLLEAKFYTKDENDGINVTNIITMPKVRVVSDINLRLGERADPTTSVFNIIAMPANTDVSRDLIMEIVRLDKDIDADI